METIEAIFKRRSIRKFNNKKIEKEKIETILRCAMQAPTARNTQAWKFIVVEDREVLNSIPKVHPYAEMMYEAQLAICVCGDLSIEKSKEYNCENCSAATQNILLSAFELGLGSVWLGVYPREERMQGIKKLFNLPDHIIPITLIALGYPNETISYIDRYDPKKIFYNKFI